MDPLAEQVLRAVTAPGYPLSEPDKDVLRRLADKVLRDNKGAWPKGVYDFRLAEDVAFEEERRQMLAYINKNLPNLLK